MEIVFISISLAAASGVLLGSGESELGGAITAVLCLIASLFTPIIEGLLTICGVLWVSVFMVSLMLRVDSSGHESSYVGVRMPGNYPLGGFKKPTIKNMTRWS